MLYLVQYNRMAPINTESYNENKIPQSKDIPHGKMGSRTNSGGQGAPLVNRGGPPPDVVRVSDAAQCPVRRHARSQVVCPRRPWAGTHLEGTYRTFCTWRCPLSQ